MNLVNLESVSHAFGLKPLLADVSLGIEQGDRIGVVGRNGGGKTTLISIISGTLRPDSGRVTHTRNLRMGMLSQRDEFDPDMPVKDIVLAGRAEHEWAGDAAIREILARLLGDVDLASPAGALSGGERRRTALARLLIGEHDLIVLDEPTNHLDIEAIAWLAGHLSRRRSALLVVTHDRWFLDAVATRTWEVVDGTVERYEGGYAAYVLAKAERARLAQAAEERRQNLMRKEIAWLRRGPPARTSKPKFRINAAEALIANEPPPRETVELLNFASARLGKTVFDLEDVTLHAGGPGAGPLVLDHSTYQFGPGDRIGLIGVNGSGKSSVLRLLSGTVTEDSGRVVRGRTVRLAHLSQELHDLDPSRRVLETVEEVRKYVQVGKKEWSASQLLERLGFRGEAQWKVVGDLSGGERRRLQLLRLIMDEPNVLLLDEPTNDLDIETLTELEDLLDGWAGTLVVVSHDRYFLERVADRCVALLGDGRLSMLPGGVDEYLERRASGTALSARAAASSAAPAAVPAEQRQGGDGQGADQAATAGLSAKELRELRKELNRLERQLDKLGEREAALHADMAGAAGDFTRLAALDADLREVGAQKETVELEWMELAERLEGQ
ncbi:ABC-F family ATP-binding cassette domain-containing protein [Microbispora triticiradicis]|uniref:ABC-F family ATP-binding cassette domain-containing protein n=2 Tax=Microbispora TaxID=2005 RepID=A0ABY3M4I3_9ACTN|nr:MULTISPECIES: ABC-F family ATP-binding cassette domain-containing protein [Microbispora]TLP56995.1 ABC-F family ATP-binding cassette domain-containing protein [Microbispora fusca]TYB66951.1 ABC-F family ATP-binding cassette domain-containing protein [Microbispora tritici]